VLLEYRKVNRCRYWKELWNTNQLENTKEKSSKRASFLIDKSSKRASSLIDKRKEIICKLEWI